MKPRASKIFSMLNCLRLLFLIAIPLVTLIVGFFWFSTRFSSEYKKTTVTPCIFVSDLKQEGFNLSEYPSVSTLSFSQTLYDREFLEINGAGWQVFKYDLLGKVASAQRGEYLDKELMEEKHAGEKVLIQDPQLHEILEKRRSKIVRIKNQIKEKLRVWGLFSPFTPEQVLPDYLKNNIKIFLKNNYRYFNIDPENFFIIDIGPRLYAGDEFEEGLFWNRETIWVKLGEQCYKGIPVYGTDLTLTLNSSGDIVGINGSDINSGWYQNLSVPIIPKISEQEAKKQIPEREFRSVWTQEILSLGPDEVTDTQFTIYPWLNKEKNHLEFRLVWRFSIRNGKWTSIVDAITGEELEFTQNFVE